MPVQPGTLGAPSLSRLLRRSRLLFHWRARDLSLNAVSGQVGTFSRASAGGAVADRDGRLYLPVHSQPRWEVPVAGGETGLLLEGARTNLVLGSSAIDSGATWFGASDFTIAAALSILAGQTAYKHTNLGGGPSKLRLQTAGVLSAAGDTTFVIVENLDADTTQIRLVDSTLSASVLVAEFTWATRVLAQVGGGSGSLFSRKLMEVGPNGGPVYLIGLSAIGTAGNGRQVRVYPSGTTTNTKSAVIHHIQLEAGNYPSSPIITAGASATRARDRLTYPLNLGPLTPATDDFTLYARFARPLFADASGSITDFPGILCLGGAAPDLRIYFNAADRTYRVGARDGVTGISIGPAIPAGGTLEVLGQFKDLATAPAVAADVGAGLSAFTSGGGIGPLPPWGSPLIGIGETSGSSAEIGAPLFEAKIANALLSLDQMREAF